MIFRERLKVIIEEEDCSPKKLALMLDTSLKYMDNYLSRRQETSMSIATKIANHPQFKQYTLWLMTGEVEPDSLQVCPAFSTQEL
ncbi:transcriptional regulator [Aliivibrio fischeri]|uniref:Transcriptional regulator n=1 Tax=Aliivibrio fischeri TaxID=668 RepID=A0A510UF33_ALIFS|nr:transcriptional regulator [Aliivibrio fischeri]